MASRGVRQLVQRRLITVPTSRIGPSTPAREEAEEDPLAPSHPVDELGIPLGPAPSPPSPALMPQTQPSLTDEKLLKLHRLSSLHPPGPPGSPAFGKLKSELEAMVSMVDAVRRIDVSSIERELQAKGESVPDGRIWPEGRGIEVDWRALVEQQKAFLEARRTSVPGVDVEGQRERRRARMEEKQETRKRQTEEARRIVAAGKEGRQLFRRRGVGKRPDEEGVYYAVRRRKRGVGDDQDDDDDDGS